MWNLYPSTFVERSDCVRKECFVVQKIKQKLLKTDRATMGQRNIPQFLSVMFYLLLHIGKITQFGSSKGVISSSMSFFDPFQGTEIIPLLTSALNDELHWKTPDQFNPSNFLDANGNFIRREAFIPFSIGKRAVGVKLMAVPPDFRMKSSVEARGHRTEGKGFLVISPIHHCCR